MPVRRTSGRQDVPHRSERKETEREAQGRGERKTRRRMCQVSVRGQERIEGVRALAWC